jgi:hypothetical protein
MEALQQNINYLGANSYPAILHESISALESVKADTIVGTELVKEVLSKTSKSLAPMLAISEFLTNAEAISKDDESIADVISFMKKQFKGGDLNFLINLAKEEHFTKLSRTGFPAPAETIKTFKDSFNKKSSELEKLIGEGIFDTLESDIYGKVREMFPDLKKSKNKLIDEPIFKNDIGLSSLNESVTYNQNGIMKYNPIGMQYEDIENERILLLTESDILSFDSETKKISKVTEQVNLPQGHIRMMTAITELVYDYEKQVFAPSQRWDFKLGIDKNGDVILSNPKIGYEAQTRKIKKDDLRGFLEESIAHYDSLLVKPTNYDKKAYARDADNLILLAENHNQILKLDNLLVLKNQQHQKYVMMNSDLTQAPQIFSGSDQTEIQLYESYSKLQGAIEQQLQSSLGGIFENQISQEQLFSQDNISNIQKLEYDNGEIEVLLADVCNMKKIADEDSATYQILFEQEKDLTSKLEANIISQTYYRGNSSMYKF